MIRAKNAKIVISGLTRKTMRGETVETGLFKIVETVGHDSKLGVLTIVWSGVFSTLDGAKREAETVLKQKIDWTEA